MRAKAECVQPHGVASSSSSLMHATTGFLFGALPERFLARLVLRQTERTVFSLATSHAPSAPFFGPPRGTTNRQAEQNHHPSIHLITFFVAHITHIILFPSCPIYMHYKYHQ